MPKLAKTLERIRDDPEGFYNGDLAKDIVQDIKVGGGIFTLDGLKNYKVKFRRPMNGTLGNYSWYSTPPPGSGVVLTFILNILKGGYFFKSCFQVFFHRIYVLFSAPHLNNLFQSCKMVSFVD